ncbi:sensor histidine kinase [Sphingomonas arenae]|uniref:sensor histidine kinase n=1 Tax=Sphingomonas arenae TaxID=2812555 RepID=UPI0019676C6B|nr:sensor histidine kinase [Sphingomonas arenae]
MIGKVRRWFQRLPTAGKLLVILSAAVLPLGLVLVLAATAGIGQANSALRANAEAQGRSAARAVESLIARNALALRVAASGALREPENHCEYVRRSLRPTSGVAENFALTDARGLALCASGSDRWERLKERVTPGDIRLWISQGGSGLYYRVGLADGHATGLLSSQQLRDAALSSQADVARIVVTDGTRTIRLVDNPQSGPFQPDLLTTTRRVGRGQIDITTAVPISRIESMDRVIILLPVLMWVAAALLSWWLVNSFLIRPLRRIQKAVSSYQPGGEPFHLPERLGSANEIQELGQAFTRAVERIEKSEHDMAEALEGQRKLVREVHHRVKNNLQVVASLLNIHGRSAGSQDARDAYASIGRRVDALAVVHRNHYAELEENRGIALRPLLSELAASLRGSAPDNARGLAIDLDLESLNTTQDVAVAIAFLTTEIVEFAMLTQPEQTVQLSLRRRNDLSARFELQSPALVDHDNDEPDRKQFERIVAGLAKQLRSTLDREPGKYGVDLPIFPPR